MPTNNRLSIYLVKEEYQTEAEIIKQFDERIEIPDTGVVYIGSSSKSIPPWSKSFFIQRITTDKIFTANARTVMLVRVRVEQGTKERIFLLTFGYGRNLLCDDVVEERFGIKVILNTIDPASLRRISKINIGGNQKISYEQLPLKAGIDEFGFDINRDIVSHIAGESNDDEYVKGILAGGDILTLTAPVDISNITEFLIMTYRQYRLEKYKQSFGWIDQIQYIKDNRLLDELNNEMIRYVNDGSNLVWAAVPDIIAWEDVLGFSCSAGEIHDDIKIEIIKASFRNPLTSVEQLKSKRIYVIDATSEAPRQSWSIYHCMFGEIEYEGSSYCLNSGKWYRINKDFTERIDQDYFATELSTIEFDECPASCRRESKYSQAFQENHSDSYILMDTRNVFFGGSHSQVEVCDLLSKELSLIHVKPYSGSSTLSHLFNQATVSAELLLSEPEFLKKANEKIKEVTDDPQYQIIDPHKIRIVFAIISYSPDLLPNIPFFSKVTFHYTKSRLSAFGLNVSIKNIHKATM